MKDKTVTLALPEEVSDIVLLTKENTFQLDLNHSGFSYSRLQERSQAEIPLLPVPIASLLSIITMIAIYLPYHQIPLSGNRSIATLVIVLGILTGTFNFTYFFTKGKQQQMDNISPKLYWRNYPAVILTYISLLIILLFFVFWLLGQFFLGVTFDIYTASFLGALIIAIVNYSMIKIAMSLTPRLMMQSLIAMILSGAIIAMITNRDQQWWLYNFSFLGTPEATRSWQFNITLILSSLQMISLIDYLFVFLYNLHGTKLNLRILKILLILTALCLGGVGLFPYNDIPFYQLMHNRSAGYLVYLFIIMIASIRWLLPSVSKQFLKISYLMGLLLVLACFLFLGIDYLSLTVFELLSFIIAFSWLLLLLQNLIASIDTKGKQVTIQVIHSESN